MQAHPVETKREGRTVSLTLITTRRFMVWVGISSLVSIFLALTPGFDALAYFFCLVIAPVLSIASGNLAISNVQQAKQLGDTRPQSPWRILSHSLLLSLNLTLVPLAIISANILRVKVCDYGSGLLFYLVGPVMSAVFGTAIGHGLGLALRSGLGATLSFIGLILLSCGQLLWHFYHHPTIFAYNPYIGFISGAVYDDVIHIGHTFLLYRLNNVFQALAFLFCAQIYFARSRRPAHQSHDKPRIAFWTRFALALSTVVSLFFYLQRGSIGYEIERGHIETELSGIYQTKHFVIYYPQNVPYFKKNIALIAEDHEFRFTQLTQELATVVPYKIRSYLYTNNSQKRRLMGADKVQIAKPWLGEIHLTRPEYGAEVLKHELAHIFAANFAIGPLRIPTVLGFVPKMGLVEGLAVAVESSRGRLSLHQWSATLMMLDKLPDMTKVLGPAGYFSTYGATAYTTAGSFIRFLIDQYGIGPVQKAYAGGDFDHAFEQPLPVLVTQWKSWISDPTRVPIAPDDLERARFIYDRKPIFNRICPLVVASLEREAEMANRRGNYEESLTIWRKVTFHNPHVPEKRFAQLDLLIRLGRFEEARQLGESIVVDPQTSAILRTRTELTLADVDWIIGSNESALASYRKLLSAPLSEDELRGIEVRYLALHTTDPTTRRDIGHYLVSRLPTDKARAALWAAAKRQNEPLLTYLVGKALFSEQRYLSAAVVLSSVVSATHLPTRLRREAERCLGEAWYHVGVYDWATHYFQQAAANTPPLAHGMLATLADWNARVRWKQSGTPTAVDGSVGIRE